MFKVGDRVRYLPCKGDSDGAWQNVKITRIDDEGYWGDDDNKDWQDGYFPFKSDSLELIEAARSPIPDDIAARAVELVERIAGGDRGWWAIEAEARAILDALKPVSVDEKVAADIAMTNSPGTFPTDTCGLAEWVAKGIAKGRSLERGGE